MASLTLLLWETALYIKTYFQTLDTLGGKLVFVAFGTIDVVLFGDKRLCSDGVFASAANEALFVPLASLVLHLFHAYKKCTNLYFGYQALR